jgi:hypothetical protein
VITVEMRSMYYKFMIELKKSPGAVTRYQAEAHLLSLDEGFGFPKGGRYFRIYGEGFKRGHGMFVHEVVRP